MGRWGREYHENLDEAAGKRGFSHCGTLGPNRGLEGVGVVLGYCSEDQDLPLSVDRTNCGPARGGSGFEDLHHPGIDLLRFDRQGYPFVRQGRGSKCLACGAFERRGEGVYGWRRLLFTATAKPYREESKKDRRTRKSHETLRNCKMQWQAIPGFANFDPSLP